MPQAGVLRAVAGRVWPCPEKSLATALMSMGYFEPVFSEGAREPRVAEGALVDTRTSRRMDGVIVDRADEVMRHLLKDCMEAPMDPDRLEATIEVQQMLRGDVAAATRRLELT